jgi:hypothetical protein
MKILFLLVVCALPSLAIDADTLAYYSLNNGVTLDLTDGTSNHNNLTGSGTPTAIASPVGGAMHLVGSSSQYAATNSTVLDGLAAGTVEMRVRCSAFDGGIFIYVQGSGTNNFAIVWPNTSGGTLKVYINSNSAVTSTKTNWALNTWYSLAVTWDVSNNLRIYVDGALDSTTAVGSGTVAAGASSQIITLGAFCTTPSGPLPCAATGAYVSGDMDEVEFSDIDRSGAYLLSKFGGGGAALPHRLKVIFN